tara:strand:+ start:108 stop:707 length:600 start_codon:yes stop_codon:yes gene_type:complete
MAEVVCRYCEQAGEVTVLKIVGKNATIQDHIDHLPTCSMRQKRRVQPKHLRKRGWVKQEKRAAQVLGGRTTPASGSLGEDGDIRQFHGIRVECKQSETGSYFLGASVWRKLVQGARRSGETPILQVELTDQPGRPWRIYVIPRGAYDLDSDEINQKGTSSRLRLERGVEIHTPFHVTLLDPHPVVVTEPQLLEAMQCDQ